MRLASSNAISPCPPTHPILGAREELIVHGVASRLTEAHGHRDLYAGLDILWAGVTVGRRRGGGGGCLRELGVAGGWSNRVSHVSTQQQWWLQGTRGHWARAPTLAGLPKVLIA